MPSPTEPKRPRGRPPGTGTGRTTQARNLSITPEDWEYLQSRNVNPSKAVRELIAEARHHEAVLMTALERAANREP